MNLPDTHLDLGCGNFARNPYERTHLYGVDIRELPKKDHLESRAANLALDAIPYADNMFGSVSAFDFIEHIPRVLAVDGGRATKFPFIDLMSEIWRVLAPHGRLYALTPAFPQPEVFVDPTHVNVITEGTHHYFCGESPLGRIYGFNGQFKPVRVEWVRPEPLDFTGPEKAAEREALRQAQLRQRHPARRAARAVREWLRAMRGKGDRKTHLLWELEAVKPPLPEAKG